MKSIAAKLLLLCAWPFIAVLLLAFVAVALGLCWFAIPWMSALKRGEDGQWKFETGDGS